MKLTLTKLGRIDHADIDIRPLTVFIGPNGTNKTWAAYSLYGLLRTISPEQESVINPRMTEFDDDSRPVVDRLNQLFAPVLKAASAQEPPDRESVIIDVEDLFKGIVDTWQHTIGSSLLEEILGVSTDVLRDAEAVLDFKRDEFARHASKIEVLLEPGIGRLVLSVKKRDGKAKEIRLTTDQWSEDELFHAIWRQLWGLIDRLIVFPAERKGLLLAMDRLNKKGEATLLPAHADFLAFTRLGRTVRAKTLQTPDESLAPHLARIVGGEIVFGSDGGGEGPLALRLSDGRSLPLESASSLSRAVAGLSLYINHFVTPNDVLVIDELEMNAHPEAQMGLVELIAMLVNRGVRIVVTTHSPYVVDHLNNLMEAARVPSERREPLAAKFQLGTPTAFISPEKVACHAFEEERPGGSVVVRDVLDRTSGLIDWSTFSRVSERMSNLYNEVLKATV